MYICHVFSCISCTDIMNFIPACLPILARRANGYASLFSKTSSIISIFLWSNIIFCNQPNVIPTFLWSNIIFCKK